jgi:hypothetical protein
MKTKVQHGRRTFSFISNVPPKTINNSTNVKLGVQKHATHKDKIPQLKVGKRAAYV